MWGMHERRGVWEKGWKTRIQGNRSPGLYSYQINQNRENGGLVNTARVIRSRSGTFIVQSLELVRVDGNGCSLGLLGRLKHACLILGCKSCHGENVTAILRRPPPQITIILYQSYRSVINPQSHITSSPPRPAPDSQPPYLVIFT